MTHLYLSSAIFFLSVTTACFFFSALSNYEGFVDQYLLLLRTHLFLVCVGGVKSQSAFRFKHLSVNRCKRNTSSSLLHCSLPWILETVSVTEPGAFSFSATLVASKFQRTSWNLCLQSPSTGYRRTWPYPSLLFCWGLNSGPSTFIATALTHWAISLALSKETLNSIPNKKFPRKFSEEIRFVVQ